MDVKSKDWRKLRKDLEADIKEAQKKSDRENAQTMELMLQMLDNIKVRSTHRSTSK
jgi:hypothetical protein